MISFSLDLHVELHVAGGANASRVAPRASMVPLYPERIQRSGPRLAQLAAGSNVCFNMKSTQISRAPTDVRDGRSPELRLMLRPIVQISCVLVRRRSGCTSPNTPEHGLLVLPCKTLMRKVPTKIALLSVA